MKKGEMSRRHQRRARNIVIGVGLAAGAIVAALAFAINVACVPADTRPPPGRLTMTVSPSPAVANGVTTVDGWRVTFDRVFVALGDESLADNCAIYGEAEYDRVINLHAGASQHLGVLHALGKCDLRFRLGPPSSDAVLGAQVSEADKAQMRAPFKDPYTGLSPNGAGAGLDIQGTASRDDNGTGVTTTKKFHLIYRRRIRYQRCTSESPPADASTVELTALRAFSDAGPTVSLEGKEEVVFDLVLEPEAMLRDDPNPSAGVLRFNPFALADRDNNGEITLDELRTVTIASIRDGGASFEAGTYDVDDAGLLVRGRPIAIESLGDYVYELLIPTLLRFRGSGWCVAAAGRRGG
jgi:hypothetical protein